MKTHERRLRALEQRTKRPGGILVAVQDGPNVDAYRVGGKTYTRQEFDRLMEDAVFTIIVTRGE